MKTIHFHLNTADGPFSSKSDWASYRTVSCNQMETCDFYKKGQCAKVGLFCNCPYGEYHNVKGYTRKAQGYRRFLSDAREKYKDVPNLRDATGTVAVVGKYVYLPFNFLDNMVNPIAIGLKHRHFIRREDFTPQFITELLNYHPQALFGGEIRDHQQKEVPIFLRGLRERFPELLEQAVALNPSIRDRLSEITNVGRKARLRSLTPNIGQLKDIRGGLWTWDGTYLTSKNSHAAFLLVREFSELRILPTGNEEVVITDDRQVNENTEFTS